LTVKQSFDRRPTLALLAGLFLLSAVPVVAGTVRIVQLISNDYRPADARFFDAPLPVVIHILASAVFALLGALQIAVGRGNRRPRWHRPVGWAVVPSGLVAGLSGLWMTLFYPWPAGDGVVLYGLRLVFGSAMVVSLGLAVLTILRRDVAGHRAWMLRGYAIGLGAGTQVLTHLVGSALIGGAPNEFERALLMGAGWGINLLIAEWVIRRRTPRAIATRQASGMGRT
jgi:uncharacterized membrane protein